MIGLAFYCNGCHRFKATQDGHVLRLANGYWSTPSPQTLSGADAMVLKLTNGGAMQTMPLLLCTVCLPPGVDSEPLASIGVLSEGSKISVTGVQDFLRANEKPPHA